MAGKRKKAKTKAQIEADERARKEAKDAADAAKIGVTIERYSRDDWHNPPAVRKGAKVSHPPRVVSRIARFQRDGWIDTAGAAALDRYELMVQEAGYDHARSCLDRSPVSNDKHKTPPPMVASARSNLAAARNALLLSSETGFMAVALMVTDELLFSVEAVETVIKPLLSGGRDVQLAEARAMVGAVAASLHIVFDTRKAA